MKNRSRLISIAAAALLALAFAGSGLTTAATAAGMDVSWAHIYVPAALAAAICALGACSTVGAIVAAVLFVGTAGAFITGNIGDFGAMKALFAAWSGESVDPQALALGGRLFMTCAAFFAGAVFFGMLNSRELATPAIMLLAALLVGSHALSGTASLGAAVPGLIAGAAAFALTNGVQRDETGLRALPVAALALAAALLLAPAEGTTSETMEEAAVNVRAIIEQYINFTRERVAFSINDEGYDHGGETEDGVVAMLGGPAQPHDDPVMEVTTDRRVLLRGAIRTTYTGYSWVDLEPKNRYLYYDPTHRRNRSDALDMDRPRPSDAFVDVSVSVKMLSDGTSTLFVPGRMSDFSMDLRSAVYYNTAGEMFLARTVEAGDSYSLSAALPVEGEGLRRAAIAAQASADEDYQAVLMAHSTLPAGVDDRLYALTAQIVADAQTPYDRAVAIQNYLRRSMRYSLDVEYPPLGRDFASWFVLDSQVGYCSYYATAMAVMGRIAGLPTRYVEGYAAHPGEEGSAVLTGWDAHAWCEVYFSGLGWIPFDATSGAAGYGPQTPGNGDDSNDDRPDGSNQNDGTSDGEGSSDTPEDQSGEADLPTPSPEPQGQDGGMPTEPPDMGTGETPDAGAEDGQMPEDPADDMTAQTPPEAQPPDDPAPQPQSQPPQGEDAPNRDHPWLWALLLLLALAAALILAARWVRARLRRADPNWLSGQTRNASEAAMVVYRANLTVLSHMGQAPANGETPEAFARRLQPQYDSANYVAFVCAVADHRYGQRPLTRKDVEAGLRAYNTFTDSMGRFERLRYNAFRVFKGLGNFESIP